MKLSSLYLAIISGTGEPDLAIPPAMDGLLRIHKQLIDAQSGTGKISTRLLVAGEQAGSLIGKQGATIKSIRDSSGCNIRVLRGEHLPVFALANDRIVVIKGHPVGLHKAVELIATHLRKFLVHYSVVRLIEAQMRMSNTQANQNMPPPPQAFPMSAGGGVGYVPPPQYIPPPPQYENYYPPTDMPSLDKPPHTGPPPYGRDACAGAHTTSFPPEQSMVTKVTLQIPLSYADAIIGTSHSNISYIRRSSGATIAIQESGGAPGEMTVEINGSASQVHAAQQMIQNSIAAAASSVQNSAPDY